ncbi:MAG: ADP-glyceromanno-heptose 6-epimerase [Candidatus Sungbacteria bacterium]|nr:ADP-glyceromanno-heptose 6-epimerase [Candidatus Sungbacteria bacterium]
MSESNIKKIIITGAAGFIGTNVAKHLSEKGYSVVAVDYLKDSDEVKKKNLEAFKYEKYYDRDEFLELVKRDALPPVEAIVHLGADTNTQETDTEYLLKNNTEYTKELFLYCVRNNVRFLYASSAATYGDGSKGYSDNERNLKPLNPYGLSKHLFDEWCLEQTKKPPQWAGFKFFNVCGPHEEHKGTMASVVYKGFHEIQKTETLKLFKSYRNGYNNGKQKRDFIFVADIASVILFFLDHPEKTGIFNVGTGQARTFLDLGHALFKALGKKPNIEFIDMPEGLKDQYQYFTEADIGKLRSAGYTKEFTSLEEGVRKYVVWLKNKNTIA